MENNLCKICGKEIPEKRLQQGKNTCCHRCAVKLSCQNPEVSARKSAAQKKRFQDPEKHKKFCDSLRKPETRQKLKKAGIRRYQRPEEHEKQSARMKELHTNPDYKAKHLASMHSEETLDKISAAQKKRFQDPEKHRAFIETMNKPETKVRLSKAQSLEDTKLKIFKTKRQNCTFNSSIPEKYFKNKLIKTFGTLDIEYQYRSEQYPFNCDFYIKSLDLYIECHFNWTHGYMPFDETNKNCIEQLNKWKEKAKESDFYKNAIYQWTDLDVRKAKTAKDNNLNWLCFYTVDEFEQWLNSLV